jgi:hypothetical protein
VQIIDTGLAERGREWVFSGRSTWAERDGRLYSPMFSAPLFDRVPGDVPNLYADYQLFDEHPEMRYRWEFAFPSSRFLADVDIAVDIENFYSSGAGCGVVLRAQDDNRYYCVEALDMGRKGNDYRVALMRSDASGYAVELAAGYAPHSPMSPDFTQGRFLQAPDAGSRWWRSSPEPARLRVAASGNRISACLDGKELWEVVDGTYAAGLAGLASAIDSPARFSRFTLCGTGEAGEWCRADYARLVTYPVPRHRLGGWYGHPSLGRTPDGRLLMWFGCAQEGRPGIDWRKGDEATAFMASSDEGRAAPGAATSSPTATARGATSAAGPWQPRAAVAPRSGTARCAPGMEERAGRMPARRPSPGASPRWGGAGSPSTARRSGSPTARC